MPFMNKNILLNLYYSTAKSRSDSNTTSFLSVIPSTSQSSTAQVGLAHTNVLIIAVGVSAGFLLILLVVILVTTTVLLLRRHEQKRGIITTVTCYCC